MENNQTVPLKQQLDVFIRSIIHKDWMTEDEYNQILNETFSTLGVNYDTMVEQLEIGIENGYPAEIQFKFLKELVSINPWPTGTTL